MTSDRVNIFYRDVFAISGSRKRKRSEVALAIDGQGVNIHDHSSRLITRYSVSPQATITCPPCSFRTRSARDKTVQRHTYCSINGLRCRILYFLEASAVGKSIHDFSTFSVDLEGESPLVHLDILPDPTSQDKEGLRYTLLAFFRDGQVRCYSPHLDLVWNQTVPGGFTQKAGEQGEILYATLLSGPQAIKTILNHRQDITKLLNIDEDNERSFLFTLFSKIEPSTLGRSRVQATLYDFSSRAETGSDPSNHSMLTELLSHELPLPEKLDERQSVFSLHAPSGTLYQQHTKGIAIYDLQSFVPRIAHLIAAGPKNVLSCLRISSHVLATITGQTVNFLGLPLCSLQASVAINGGKTTAPRSEGIKPTDDVSTRSASRLLSYSRQHNLLSVWDGQEVVPVPVSRLSVAPSSQKRNREGSLISSLGRPFTKQATEPAQTEVKRRYRRFGLSLAPLRDDAAWRQIETSLDQYLLDKDTRGFETTVNEKLRVNDRPPRLASHRAVSYLLSKIFQIDRNSATTNDLENEISPSLKVVFWPTMICQWLISQGLLIQDRVETALREFDAVSVSSQLAPGALIKAVAHSGTSLHKLDILLTGPLPFGVRDIGHALSAVVGHLKALDTSGNQNLLENGEGRADANRTQTLQHMNEDNGLGAMPDERLPKSDGPHANKRLLYSLLQKMKIHRSPSLVQALRQSLTPAEMRSLVDILRVEMADNGWLSHCVDDDHVMPSDDTGDDQITLIAHALNVLLDALGPTGWMLGQSSPFELTESADTISYMKAEVSAALEGIEEATYLRQMLGEMLICGKDALRPPPNKALKYGEESPASGMVKPTIVPLAEETSLLPLGLKLKPEIPMTKVGAGGEIIPRSKRDIGRLKSRRVGKYSFERIEF